VPAADQRCLRETAASSVTRHLVEACALCLEEGGAYEPATKAHPAFSHEGVEGTTLLCDSHSQRYAAAARWVSGFLTDLWGLNDDAR
jgi:hypothetical protein